MADDDDFADFTSAAYSSTGPAADEKPDASVSDGFHVTTGSAVFEIPPLDFEQEDIEQFGTFKTSSGDLFNAQLPLPSDLQLPQLGPLPSELLPPLETLPQTNEPLPFFPDVGVITDTSNFNGSLPGDKFSADFSNFTVNVAKATEKPLPPGGDDFTHFTTPISQGEADLAETNVSSEFVADFSGFMGVTESVNDIAVTTGGSQNFVNDDFGSFSDHHQPVPSVPDDEFANFQEADDDKFANFQEAGDDDFANFASFSETSSSSSKPQTMTGSNDKPSVSNRDIDDDFGDFDSVPVAPPTLSAPPIVPATPSTKNPVEALKNCFPAQVAKGGVKTTSIPLKDCLSSDEDSKRVWSELNLKAESMRFFFQWQNSFLQDRFYSAVKVDPMLIPVNPKATPVFLSLGPLGDNESLLVSGGGVKDNGRFDEGGATLLDLSLPLSPPPSEQVSESSFGGDLLGLTLSTTNDQLAPPLDSTHSKVEETPTLWMDSELLELEAETGSVPTSSTTSNTYDWLARLATTTPTIPLTSATEGSSDLSLVETKSTAFDLLVSGGADDDMGWSVAMTNPVSEPVAMEIKPDSVTVDTESTTDVKTQPVVIDTTPLDSILTLFPTPSSFPSQKIISTSEPPVAVAAVSEEGSYDLQQRVLALVKKLPQLNFMTSETLMT